MGNSIFNIEPFCSTHRIYISTGKKLIQKNNMASTLLSVVQFLALLASSQAFAPVATSSVRPGSEPLQMIDFSDVITTASNSMWLATIDGDIANISDNEFKTVFAGGIVSKPFEVFFQWSVESKACSLLAFP
jgi:hypothetical protein